MCEDLGLRTTAEAETIMEQWAQFAACALTAGDKMVQIRTVLVSHSVQMSCNCGMLGTLDKMEATTAIHVSTNLLKGGAVCLAFWGNTG